MLVMTTPVHGLQGPVEWAANTNRQVQETRPSVRVEQSMNKEVVSSEAGGTKVRASGRYRALTRNRLRVSYLARHSFGIRPVAA
jgi:hypothetical protein